MNMDKLIGADFEKGLWQMKAVVERKDQVLIPPRKILAK